MPVRRTTLANPNRAQRKCKLVVKDDKVLRRNIELLNQSGHRKPAQIHKRLRLRQQNILPASFALAVSALPRRFVTITPQSSAMRSTAKNPALCGVNRYSIPGFP